MTEADQMLQNVGTFEDLREPSKAFFSKFSTHDQVESIGSALPRAATRVAPGETN